MLRCEDRDWNRITLPRAAQGRGCLENEFTLLVDAQLVNEVA